MPASTNYPFKLGVVHLPGCQYPVPQLWGPDASRR